MTYRPRGTLARTLYDKIHNDQYLEGYDMRLVRIRFKMHTPHYLFITKFAQFCFLSLSRSINYSVVYAVEGAARTLSSKIFAIGKTGRSNAALVESGQRIIQ